MGPIEVTQAEQNTLERQSKVAEIEGRARQDLDRKRHVERRDNKGVRTAEERIALGFTRLRHAAVSSETLDLYRQAGATQSKRNLKTVDRET